MIRVAIVEDEAAVRDQLASRSRWCCWRWSMRHYMDFCICLNSAELRRPG
ncbi:hypothetical protein [uncultured Gemmiger sp.]|nr:hypothetical protein [uncultured Gemmiger sp.]